MIGFLTGRTLVSNDSTVIIDVSGVGYRVFVSAFTIQKISKDAALYIYTHVREQEISLYGFLSQEEYDMFILLISISGIGPKAALNILSIADASTVATAIAQEDITILTTVSGIGKRTAEKVVRELSGKVVPPVDMAIGDAKRNADAIEALRSMGYSVVEARDALSNVSKDVTDVGECVKCALKYLGK